MAMSDKHSYLQPFTSNGDVSIWVKNSQVGRLTPYEQNKQESPSPEPVGQYYYQT